MARIDVANSSGGAFGAINLVLFGEKSGFDAEIGIAKLGAPISCSIIFTDELKNSFGV